MKLRWQVTGHTLFIIGMWQASSVVESVIFSSAMLGVGQIFGVSGQTYLVSIHSAQKAATATGYFQFSTFGGVTANGVLLYLTTAFLPYKNFVLASALVSSTSVLLLLILVRRMREGQLGGGFGTR